MFVPSGAVLLSRATAVIRNPGWGILFLRAGRHQVSGLIAAERSVEVAALVAELGYAEPVVDSEISDPADGHALGIADACWPEGLRPGQGKPVVLMLDPKESSRARLQELGYEVFTSAESLKGDVLRRNQEAAGRSHESTASDQTRKDMVDAPEAASDADVWSDFERALKDV